MRKHLLIGLIAIAFLGFGFSGSAQAETLTDSIIVGATVDVSCEMGSVSNLSFASFSGATVDTTANVTVNCSNGTPYTIKLDVGGASFLPGNPGTPTVIGQDEDGNDIIEMVGATPSTRRADDGAGHYLAYEIYQDSSHTTTWYDGVFGPAKTGTGGVPPSTHTLYGRIPAQPAPLGGSYNDTVGLTVEY